MNDILKNVEPFLNILGMSHSSVVQQWDQEAFNRAFKWAHFFEQVSVTWNRWLLGSTYQESSQQL